MTEMKMKCFNCGKKFITIVVNHIIGELKGMSTCDCYCSVECRKEFHRKNKIEDKK